MNPFKIVANALFVVMLSLPAHAQEASRHEHTLTSEFPSQERTFTIQLPASYDTQPDFAYPVLYVLDGENNLDYSVAVAEFLAQNALVPEMIIVGVHTNGTRDRDYLPPRDADGRPSGQADQFLRYLSEELVPFVEATYRAAPLRLISGHSFGGVFVTYAMVEHPEMFRAYLTQSPFLDRSIGGPLVERVSDVLANNPELNAFYYMNVGAEPNLEQNYRRMEGILGTASSDSFVWASSHEADKTHMTTRLVGQYEALERFFAEDWALSRAVEKMVSGGTEGLDRHFDRLSRDYGHPAVYDEGAFQQTTQGFLSQQNLPYATASAQIYVRQHPASSVAHFLLGVTLASGGDQEKGLEVIETAIQLFEADPTPEMQPVYEQMKQMRQRLGGGSQ